LAASGAEPATRGGDEGLYSEALWYAPSCVAHPDSHIAANAETKVSTPPRARDTVQIMLHFMVLEKQHLKPALVNPIVLFFQHFNCSFSSTNVFHPP
jgi:hypothetical protein